MPKPPKRGKGPKKGLPQRGGKKKLTRKRTQPYPEPTDKQMQDWRKDQGL